MVGLIFFVCGCFGVSCTDNQLEHKVRDQLQISFNRRPNNTKIRNSYERMEMKYTCCGVSGPKDYSGEFNNKGLPGEQEEEEGGRKFEIQVLNVGVTGMVPYSCCLHFNKSVKYDKMDPCVVSKAWDEGCASVVTRLFTTLFLNMGCIAIPAGTLMLLFGITTLWYGHIR